MHTTRLLLFGGPMALAVSILPFLNFFPSKNTCTAIIYHISQKKKKRKKKEKPMHVHVFLFGSVLSPCCRG
jgi:hypothetical protein